MRRRVRPPRELAAWLTAIFNAFGPLLCSNIKKVLLSGKEMKKAEQVVQDVLDGYVADLPMLPLYHPLYTEAGLQRRDSDGIALRGCSRGSNVTENLHQSLSTSMNNSWGSGLVVTTSRLLFVDIRHNERMLSCRIPGYKNDNHLNFALSSCTEKYETISGISSTNIRNNPNVLDYAYIPLIQMLGIAFA